MHRAALVLPVLAEAPLRFLRAALSLPDTRVGVVTQIAREAFPPDVASALAGHWRVSEALDPGQLVEAARGLISQMGLLDRFFGVQEQLQVPVAEARARLGIAGLDPATAANFRDKARMKAILRAHNVPCARFLLASDAAAARAFVKEVGFPVVVKPPDGAGAVGTYRADGPEALEQALRASSPAPLRPILVEEFIVGEEFSFDAVWIDGRPVWHSIGAYLPPPLEVLRNDWIQWTVLLPRRIDGPEFAPIRAAAAAALRALGFVSGMSHMEWFRRRDGSVAISEVGARPPGAQFVTLMGLAHDTDLYAAWVRTMIHGRFDPPERRFAAGGAYLRRMGRGRVEGVSGFARVREELGSLLCEAKLPERGQEAREGYEGQGYLLIRHPETDVVARALQRIVAGVRVL